ncbi:H(+)/Cl(-) exchange transporter [Echria macrotheca]|uniref:Chloride channel protein n=1 Tax=Echria macrotheca TaxID=438768 RepID=A0AAJ0B6Y7_9PEZI|nr:H(+)/Cl(-) exchange transporter [Echria macrotheca]
MAARGEEADEITPLVGHANLPPGHAHGRRRSIETASSIMSSRLSRDELALADTAIGERLPYDAYQTIDWLHDLVKDAFRYRNVKSQKGVRGAFAAAYEDYQGWIVAGLVGILTAFVAFFVDYAESSFGDLKFGYCKRNPLYGREACCFPKELCPDWRPWSDGYKTSFFIYAAVAWVLAMGAGVVTKLTRTEIPAFATHEHHDSPDHAVRPQAPNKTIYMAAGSGIPEIKLLLSGFEFPNLLSFKVLVVKAIGASLAVASGLCLGKEGPFVHISTSAGYVVAKMFPQFRDNGRRLREMLSVACSSALAVAFGSPVGGVLFVYEEMSSHFPRKVLWKAFLCSLVAAIMLKALDPTRTGRLVLFETNYGVVYKPHNYIFFVLLGISGGLFGAAFCKGSLMWTKRMKPFINQHPLVELTFIVLATAALQYPNPITREPALLMIKNLLRDCEHKTDGWICEQERLEDKRMYYWWLIYGSIVKVTMTILTVGSRIPSGLIVPALAAGAIFGRLVGQIVPDTSAAIFAMVGAAAFLAGVSRMTVSLTVIMLELTGEVEYIPPFMIAILTAKVVVDALHEEGVNDHTVLGEYLEHEHATNIARACGGLVEDLIPPSQSMADMTLHVGPEYKVLKQVLAHKLHRMKRHGLRDAALVLVDDREQLHGIISEGELDFAVHEDGLLSDSEPFDVLTGPLAAFVDRTPLTLNANAPLEMAVELFFQLGLRHVVIVEEGSSRVLGVVLKQQLILFLEHLRGL